MFYLFSNIVEHPYLPEKRTPVGSKIPPLAPSRKFILKFWIPD